MKKVVVAFSLLALLLCSVPAIVSANTFIMPSRSVVIKATPVDPSLIAKPDFPPRYIVPPQPIIVK